MYALSLDLIHVHVMGEQLGWMYVRAMYSLGDTLWMMDACDILGLDVALHFG